MFLQRRCFPMSVGNRIKQRRIELGLDVDELANRIGKSRATVYRYENGEIENMPTNVLEPIAKALQTTPAYLMGWSNDEIWDRENPNLTGKIKALHYSLHGLGWACRWLDNENVYIFSNGNTSIKINSDEYNILAEQLENFLKKKLQELILKASALEPTYENECASDEMACTYIPYTKITDVNDAKAFLKSRSHLAAWQNGTVSDGDLLNMANAILEEEVKNGNIILPISAN